MELVSAVILTHNRKQLVTRAIESVFNQTYPNLECIVVDDASDDGTKEMLSVRTDLRYIYIPKEESRGGDHARNAGIKAAQGKYVALLDDDDYWLPTKTEKQVALIEEKQCGVVYCGRRPEYVQPDGSCRYEECLPRIEPDGDLSQKILFHFYILSSGTMVRRDLLNQIGGFDEELRYWQDYELSIRLAQVSKFYAVNECLYVYRIDENDNNRLTNKFSAWKKSVRYIRKKHRALYAKLPLALQIDAIRLYNGDAYNRATRVGLKWPILYHRIIRFILKRVRYIIK